MAELDKVHLSKGDVIARRYEIEEELGSGLLGVTYKARHITSGKFLVIKVLKPSLIANPRDRSRFEQAFQRTKALRHEGLVRYGEVGEHEDLVYFTQEYFPSQSLRQLIDQYLEQRKTFTFQEASQVILKVLRIADFLHQNQVIHRNLKPENVLIHTRAVGPNAQQMLRTVKITDVGLADVVNPTIFADSYVSRTEARYLAPELNAFDDQGQPCSDVYSIGVMYYEMLVGQTPRGTYLAPSQLRGDLPEYVDNIVEVAMEVETEDRYPTAPDMIKEIMRIFDGEVFDDSTKSNFKNILMAVGIGALLAGGIAIWVGQDPPNPMEELQQQDQELREAAFQTIETVDEATRLKYAKQNPERGDELGMVYVHGGDFVQGMLYQEEGSAASNGVKPNPVVVQDVPGFYIDLFEYPNKLGVKPEMGLTFEQARQKCVDQGKDLCTAQQWEKACRGKESLIYPYGDDFVPEKCSAGSGDRDKDYRLRPDQYPECINDYGVMGMSAGPKEWTQTQVKQEESDDGSVYTYYKVKSGSPSDPWQSRCAFENPVHDQLPPSTNPIGFRCCKAVEG